MKTKHLFYGLLFILLFSCKKEEGNEPLPPISNTPEIELLTTSSTNINQFDDVEFKIQYTDGNGDLGETDPDTYSIFVTDKRDESIVHEFHLQPLAPINKSFAIQGNLRINIENIILLDQSNSSEIARFSIYIKDRAGNKSNTVTSSTIRITK